VTTSSLSFFLRAVLRVWSTSKERSNFELSATDLACKDWEARIYVDVTLVYTRLGGAPRRIPVLVEMNFWGTGPGLYSNVLAPVASVCKSSYYIPCAETWYVSIQLCGSILSVIKICSMHPVHVLVLPTSWALVFGWFCFGWFGADSGSVTSFYGDSQSVMSFMGIPGQWRHLTRIPGQRSFLGTSLAHAGDTTYYMPLYQISPPIVQNLVNYI
jgi:hypothetical protein